MASRAFTPEPSGNWLSAEEIADMALPGLPRSKRHVNERAAEERWALKIDAEGMPLARRRAGRGGGTEYHVQALPAAARAELVRRGLASADDAPVAGHPLAANDEQPTVPWAWYDRQSDKVKDEARRRVDALTQIVDYEAAGLSRSSSVAQVSQEFSVSSATLWGWLRLIAGLSTVDWLPALAPRRQGGGARAEIDLEIWQVYKSNWLRPEKPTHAQVYRRCAEMAAARGVTIPNAKTFQRRLEREVHPSVIIARREGPDALRRSIPAQRRSVADLHALQLVNIDGHKFDTMVNWGKDAKGKDIIARPIMVAIQDVYSRKFLAWRIGDVESAILTRLAFADLFKAYGIPKGCLLDNGRAFASKWITGGAMTRYRFKIKQEDPTGLLPALGINPHWATPYRGQSKPIERMFGDLGLSREPEMAGAYTGNSTSTKPWNYGAHAIPIEEFRGFVAQTVARHNARMGRRTEMANGRSFNDVFAESYATAPIGKATEDQLRLALLAGQNCRVDRNTGVINLMGNRYYSSGLATHHGQIVTVRFDPDNLHQAIHVYDLAGRYLCSPDIWEDAGFQSAEHARERSKLEARHRKAVREAIDAEQLLTPAEIVARLPAAFADEDLPEPSVVRPVRHRGATNAALKPAPRSRAEVDQEQFNDQFSSAISGLRLVE